MLKLKKKIAITGGLSCGKSTVCQIFKELGAVVIRADDIVHRHLTPDTDLGKKVIELLGNEIVVEGKIDRSRIAKKVFNHPGRLQSLEKLAHPIVYEEINKEYEKFKAKEGNGLFMGEVPLLFESGGEKYFDKVITVLAPRENCWQRFRKATGYEREEYDRRMAWQMNPFEKAKRSDYVIHNNGSLEELKNQVKQLFVQLEEN